MSNTITWQKWLDPFGSDDMESVEHDPYVGEYENTDLEPAYDSKEYANEDEEDDDEDKNKKYIIKKTDKIKVIATPMGIIPVTENTISSKIFNFWIGHTNFDITYTVADIIEKTDGVETLDIFTRYRFRIAIGKAFDDSSVMREINRRVYAELHK